jgi:predicted short-subunit dehydrogenase-like oxidoreductase (DUF2520 family)
MPKATTKRRKLSVAIVGPGRVGQALAIALRSLRHPIIAFVGRDAARTRKAVTTFNKSGTPAQTLGSDQLAQLPATDLIVITTPDDAIAEVAKLFATAGLEGTRRQTVLHTSGALASDVLSPLARIGFHTGSMHPLVSVSEPLAGAKALRGAFYCLEGDKPALRIARLIVGELKGKAFSIRPENKALYHAAAVMASPHLIALFDLATEMLAACGISQTSARQILLPLVESTTGNLLAMTPGQALTGTFARGDVATVRRHLAALSGKELAEALGVYRLLGMRSIEMANKSSQAPQQLLDQIKELLKSAAAR